MNNETTTLPMPDKTIRFSYYLTHLAPKSTSQEVKMMLRRYKKLLTGKNGKPRKISAYLRDLDLSLYDAQHDKAHEIRTCRDFLLEDFAEHVISAPLEHLDCDDLGNGCFVKRTHLGQC